MQATLAKLYVHWGRVRAATHPDAYARAVLVRESIHERRSVWVKRVSLSGGVTDAPAAAVDQDAVLDLRAAVAALPPRQRATLVLRFYCDLNVDQAAEILGCSPGTVKSQTARALEAVRRALGPAPAAGCRWPARRGGGAPDLPRRPPAMIESQIRALFAEIADGEPAAFAGGCPARPPPGPGPPSLAPGLRGRRLGAGRGRGRGPRRGGGPGPARSRPGDRRARRAAPVQPADPVPVVRLAARRGVARPGWYQADRVVHGRGTLKWPRLDARPFTHGGSATSPARPAA